MKPYYENENGKLYNCDNVKFCKTLPDNYIDLTVTSPPYDNLRDYKGYVFDFEGIAKELYRVTKKGGVVVWVVGDATIDGSETVTSFKQALYFKEIGFNIHDTMIYQSEKPPLSHDRYEQKFEYMFVFSKGKPKTFNGIIEQKKYIENRKITTFVREKDGSKSVGFSKGSVKTKLRGNVWKYKTGLYHSTTDKVAFLHPAIFPEQLASDHILSWSDTGDLVFDPFMGSGTTAKMAEVSGRFWLGCDSGLEYCEIAAKRIESENRQLKLF